ncbi:MAG: oxygen-dependent coproporphyrinogen oxidase [Chloroflexaceae bacterium]|nr:oxygen-dependent coproporphyrinogen oxidase [Chloroflexaceae bacterium]
MATQNTTRTRVEAVMRAAQNRICAALEGLEQAGASLDLHTGIEPGRFAERSWQRPGGGGGSARVLTEGLVFERGGVNVSAVHGADTPQSIWKDRPATKDQPYFATGLSMVLHPRNPYVPAFHANFRYFEAGPEWWFGGGMDLTPAYAFAEDARHFHRTLKAYCERHSLADYQTLKTTCDNYFYLKHRKEMRGIGGIFFDTLQPAGPEGFEQGLAFAADGLETILAAYLPLAERRMGQPYGERERQWQLYRRGRYAEFNLVYDKGTLFGLQTDGYIEAILMSLPPLARWEFEYTPAPGSPEAETLAFLQPQEWQ